MTDTTNSVTDAMDTYERLNAIVACLNDDATLLVEHDRLGAEEIASNMVDAAEAIDTLRVQLADARMDSERLDWIDKQTYAGAGPRGNIWMVGWKGHSMHGLDFRSAIDAAPYSGHARTSAPRRRWHSRCRIGVRRVWRK